MRTAFRLLAFLRPFVGEMLLSVMAGAATVAAGIGLLGASAVLISQAALRPSVADLQVLIVGVRFFGLSRAVFRYLERLISHSVNFRLLARLRVWFFRAIEPLAPARLWQFDSGDLLSRSVADIETLENFYVRAVYPPLVAAVITAGLGIWIGSFDPALGWVVVLGMLAGAIGVPLLSYAISRRPAEQVVISTADLQTRVVEAVQGMSDLIAYGREAEAQQRIAQADANLRRAQLRLAATGGLVNAAGLLVSLATLFAVLWLAVPVVHSGAIPGIYLGMLALTTLAGFEAVNPLPAAAQRLGSSLQAGQRLFNLADSPPAIHEPVHPLLPGESSELEVSHLTFAYSGGELVLRDVSFSLLSGKKLAIVGASGAGKTTLVNLLARFLDYEHGSIRLGGCEINRLSGVDVRDRITVIPQSPYIFTGTLRSNLLLGRPDADDEVLWTVLEQAELADWVRSLPEGLDTPVGEQGQQISGGEAQRLAVAQALLRNTPVIVLDEPTANLDAITERRLMKTFRRAFDGRSLLMITHRLAGLEWMDDILVLDRGSVIERGTHAELMAQGGVYARLCSLQQRLLVE